MPRGKTAQLIEIEKRPEPEGQGDWLYTCTGCGYQRKDGVNFNQPCPKCGGHGWMCHWLVKLETDPIKTQTDILLPLNHKPVVAKSRNPRGLSPSPGRPETILPTDLINRLAAQGLGCKAIALKLKDQGIIISHMTIQRRLNARVDKRQARLEFR